MTTHRPLIWCHWHLEILVGILLFLRKSEFRHRLLFSDFLATLLFTNFIGASRQCNASKFKVNPEIDSKYFAQFSKHYFKKGEK